jgi:hypothetical protein
MARKELFILTALDWKSGAEPDPDPGFLPNPVADLDPGTRYLKNKD